MLSLTMPLTSKPQELPTINEIGERRDDVHDDDERPINFYGGIGSNRGYLGVLILINRR